MRNIKIAAPGLCDSKQIFSGEITKTICKNSVHECEVYMKKGKVNSVQIETCSQYCSAYGLHCSEMYDDHNNCRRGKKYSTCDETGGGTSDHICVCGKWFKFKL